jgi:hypothetical protein
LPSRACDAEYGAAIGRIRFWDSSTWSEAAVAALLAALAFWAVAAAIVGIVRWIVGGRGPSA